MPLSILSIYQSKVAVYKKKKLKKKKKKLITHWTWEISIRLYTKKNAQN